MLRELLPKLLTCILAFSAVGCSAAPLSNTDQGKTSDYFETIKRSSPQRLQDFLYALPKGIGIYTSSSQAMLKLRGMN